MIVWEVKTFNLFSRRDELLNSVYSQSEFTLDEGERLLKGMQELREELNTYGEVLTTLAERAQNVVPLKQRRAPVPRPIPVLAVCSYKQDNVSSNRDCIDFCYFIFSQISLSNV